jgi:hypothetical protein
MKMSERSATKRGSILAESPKINPSPSYNFGNA